VLFNKKDHSEQLPTVIKIKAKLKNVFPAKKNKK